MKIKIGLLSLVMVLTTLSCVSTGGAVMTLSDFDIQYDRDKSIEGLSIQATNVYWDTTNILGMGNKSIKGISIEVNNQTDAIVKILWDESSISYEGKSFPVFLDGMKYINAGQVNAPPTIIAKGQTTRRDVYSSDQPHYTSGQYGGWYMGLMADEVQLVVCTAKGDEKSYETIAVKIKEKAVK